MYETKGEGGAICFVPLGDRGSTTKMSKNDMWDAYGCHQDKAKSMRICHAVQGTKITVYDKTDMNENSGTHLDITVRLDMGNSCKTVTSFNNVEKDDNHYDYLSYNRYKKGDGHLNGKISSFVITVPQK